MSARHIAKKRKARRNNGFVRLLGMIVCLGAAVAVTIVVVSLYDLGLTLTTRPIFTVILIDIALTAAPIVLTLSGKINFNMITRVCTFVVAGLVLFVNLFAASALDATNRFMGEITEPAKAGAVEYSIVAQRSARIELSPRNEVRAGIQSKDSCKEEATEETKKIVAASFTEYYDLSEMVGATEENLLDIAVVQSVLLNAYAEYFPDSYDNLAVLKTFTAGSSSATPNTSGTVVDVTKPFSVYISGADVFGDIDQVARSDANMLVLIDPVQYKILLINTPRDYYVQLHGTTGYKDKLTHAGLHGIEMSEQTIEDLYDLEINYHVRVNFDTIVNLVDAMGGIAIYNPTEFTLWSTTYAEGKIYLNGDAALMYSRARKGLAEGDFSRGDNQQRVIEAIIDRITKPHVVIYYISFIEALSGTLRSNIPPKVITQLFERQISLGGDWTIEKMNAEGKGAMLPTYSMGAQELSVQMPIEASVEEIKAAIHDFLNG